jgi:arsenate reductase
MDTATTDNPVKIMVLCTGNSCRSQMAEGFLRSMGTGKVEAYSAGLIPAGVHPLAAAVMREAGIDISRQTSDAMDPELLQTMDLVITVCDNAAEACPTTPPGVRRIHMPIQDPVGTPGTEKKRMAAFRTARDEIRQAMEKILTLELAA